MSRGTSANRPPAFHPFFKGGNLEEYIGTQDVFRMMEGISLAFGITYDIDEFGISWLEGILLNGTKCKLVVALYPACATSEENLVWLATLSTRYHGSFEVRLLAADLPARPLTAFAFTGACLERPIMSMGGIPNFGLTEPVLGDMAATLTLDAQAYAAWVTWFESLWTYCTPLNDDATAIPPLEPVEGSCEAAAMWNEYATLCRKLAQDASQPAVEELGPQPSDLPQKPISLSAPIPESTTAPNVFVEIPHIETISTDIAQLYGLGLLISIDRSTRAVPFEMPVKPEWLDVTTLKKSGNMSRRISYKISAFEEADLKRLESKRNATQALMPHFSYSLSDGQRWIPRTAIALFETELERVNKEGIEELYALTKGDHKAFVARRSRKLVKSVRDMYKEFHSVSTFSDEVVDPIMDALVERLEGIGANRLLPKATYSEVAFNPRLVTEWSSPWGQALRLLMEIAEYQRDALTDPYFFRGTKTDHDGLLDAMDVCGDALRQLSRKDPVQAKWLAEQQLGILSEIDEHQAESKSKCEAVLSLIRGSDKKAVLALLAPNILK